MTYHDLNKLEKASNRHDKEVKSDYLSRTERLSGGPCHSCCLIHSNDKNVIYIWGTNIGALFPVAEKQQTFDKPTLVELKKKIDPFDISFGRFHGVLISQSRKRNGGHLYSWGLGNLGRLGFTYKFADEPADPQNENNWYTAIPQKIEFEESKVYFKRVACGAHHTLALTTDGRVYSFGFHARGALGHGQTSCVWRPREVVFPQVSISSNFEIIDISASENYSMAVSKQGQLYIWGDNANRYISSITEDIINSPKHIVELSQHSICHCNAGDTSLACISEDGCVFTWGANIYGKLGHGDEHVYTEPTIVTALYNKNIKKVRSTTNATFFLSKNGELYCCGLGSNVISNITINEPLALPITNVLDFFASTNHVIAVDTSGNIYTWGNNQYKQLGIPDCVQLKKPTIIPELRHSMVLNDDDGMSICASVSTNDDAQNRDKICSGRFIKQIACADDHVLIATYSGNLYVTGSNRNCKLGLEHLDYTNQFFPVKTPDNELIKEVACAGDYSMFVTESGKLYAVGSNSHGQCGLKSYNVIEKFTHVPTVNLVDSVYCNSEYALYITKTDNLVFVCGRCKNGKTGSSEDYNSFHNFYQITSPVQKLAPGDSHLLILLKNGTLLACGSNGHNKLGISQSGTSQDPVTVSVPLEDKDSIIDIAAGKEHSVAISRKGRVYVWGHGAVVGYSHNLTVPTDVTHLCAKTINKVEFKAVKVRVGPKYTAVINTEGLVIIFQANLNDTNAENEVYNSQAIMVLVNDIQCIDIGITRDNFYFYGHNTDLLARGAIKNDSEQTISYDLNYSWKVKINFLPDEAKLTSNIAGNFTSMLNGRLFEDVVRYIKNGRVCPYEMVRRIISTNYKINDQIIVNTKLISYLPTIQQINEKLNECSKIFHNLYLTQKYCKERLLATKVERDTIKVFSYNMQRLITATSLLKSNSQSSLSNFSNHETARLFSDVVKIIYSQPVYFMYFWESCESESDILCGTNLILDLYNCDNEEMNIIALLRLIANDQTNNIQPEEIPALFINPFDLFKIVIQEYVKSRPILIEQFIGNWINEDKYPKKTLLNIFIDYAIDNEDVALVYFVKDPTEYQKVVTYHRQAIFEQAVVIISDLEPNKPDAEKRIARFTDKLNRVCSNSDMATSVWIQCMKQVLDVFAKAEKLIPQLINIPTNLTEIFSAITLNIQFANYFNDNKEDNINPVRPIINLITAFIIYPLLHTYPESASFIGCSAISDERIINNFRFVMEMLYRYTIEDFFGYHEDLLPAVSSFIDNCCAYTMIKFSTDYNCIDSNIVYNFYEAAISNLTFDFNIKYVTTNALMKFINIYYWRAQQFGKHSMFDMLFDTIQKYCSINNSSEPFGQDKNNEVIPTHIQVNLATEFDKLTSGCLSCPSTHLIVPQQFLSGTTDTAALNIISSVQNSTTNDINSVIIPNYNIFDDIYVSIYQAMLCCVKIDASSFNSILTSLKLQLKFETNNSEPYYICEPTQPRTRTEMLESAITAIETKSNSISLQGLFNKGIEIIKIKTSAVMFTESCTDNINMLTVQHKNKQKQIQETCSDISACVKSLTKPSTDLSLCMIRKFVTKTTQMQILHSKLRAIRPSNITKNIPIVDLENNRTVIKCTKATERYLSVSLLKINKDDPLNVSFCLKFENLSEVISFTLFNHRYNNLTISLFDNSIIFDYEKLMHLLTDIIANDLHCAVVQHHVEENKRAAITSK